MRWRTWTEPEIKRLAAYYPYVNSRDIARVMRRPISQIYFKASALGLKKAPEFNRHYLTGKEGAEYRFRKGHTPWNKGMKGLHHSGSEKTQFKKGHRPQTWVPVGTERLRDGYLVRKISDHRQPSRRNWKEVHVMLWEDHHGPVPKGHTVIFKNKDRTDIRIENLELICRGELMRRNSVHNLPPQLKELVYIKGVLNSTITRLAKHEREQHTDSA